MRLGRRRLVYAGVVAVAAIAVGIAFGWLAGVAVVLAAITLALFVLAPGAALEENGRIARWWGRRTFGSEGDERER